MHRKRGSKNDKEKKTKKRKNGTHSGPKRKRSSTEVLSAAVVIYRITYFTVPSWKCICHHLPRSNPSNWLIKEYACCSSSLRLLLASSHAMVPCTSNSSSHCSSSCNSFMRSSDLQRYTMCDTVWGDEPRNFWQAMTMYHSTLIWHFTRRHNCASQSGTTCRGRDCMNSRTMKIYKMSNLTPVLKLRLDCKITYVINLWWNTTRRNKAQQKV